MHPANSTTVAKTSKIFYGWWIVLACSGITLYSSGTFYYGFTGFFDPMVKEFGWTRAATSLAFSLQRLQGGIAAPIVGFLTDRFGCRKMMITGLFVMGVGFIGMSRVDSLTMFYLTFLLASIGSSAGSGGVGMVAVSNWFIRNRSRALGLMIAGVGLSGAMVPPLVWLIGTYGWRTAMVLAGIGIWVIGIPLASLVRHRPEHYGYLPDGDSIKPVQQSENGALTSIREEAGEFGVREALGTRDFWFLALILTLAQLATGALFVHEIPYLLSIGVPAETGALVVMFMTLSSIAGRLGFGWLGDYMDKRYVLAITYVLQFVGLLIAALAQELWQIALFVAAFGPGYGGAIPVRPALQGDYFGRKAFGAIQGLLMGVTTVGGIIGPVFAGYMYDVMGDYRLAFLVLALALVPALPSTLFMRKPKTRSKV